MERRSHPGLIVSILLLFVLWLKADLEITVYCPDQELNWAEARNYCRHTYVDLVTWDLINVDYITSWLKKNHYMTVWIGLQQDPENLLEWKWINLQTGEGVTGDDVSMSENWATVESHIGSCGSYQSEAKKWYKTICSTDLQFICFDDNLVVVTENMTWEDAVSYCRNMTTSLYQYDLLSLTTSSDYSYIGDRIYRTTTDEVWVGLRFLGGDWWWSDGQTLDGQTMLPDCPSQWKHCGTLSKNETGNWTIRDCSETRNFICSRKNKST